MDKRYDLLLTFSCILISFLLAEKALDPLSDGYQDIPLVVSSDKKEVFINVRMLREYKAPPRRSRKLENLREHNAPVIQATKELIAANAKPQDPFSNYQIVNDNCPNNGTVLYRFGRNELPGPRFAQPAAPPLHIQVCCIF